MKGGGPEWTRIADIRISLEKKWLKGTLARESVVRSGLFPLRIPLSAPGPSDLSARFAEAQDWAREYLSSGNEYFSVEWKDVNNRVLGQNRIPQAVIFKDLVRVAGFLGRVKEYSAFICAADEIIGAFPELKGWLLKNTGRAVGLLPVLDRLIPIVRWIAGHPSPGIYLRQLSIDGADTKFIESHKKIIGDWLDILLSPGRINTASSGIRGFEDRYGFLSKPPLIRFRFLDGRTSGGFSDLTVRADEFCRMPQEAGFIFVTENDINGLSFPPVKNGIVVFGRGYGFDYFRDASWMKDKDIWYWGDIDTHGFAILSQFREYFPRARSFLMNSSTLIACRENWSIESEQNSYVPGCLDKEELRLFLDLKENRFGKSVRLEQELVPFDIVRHALADIGCL